MYRTCCNLNLNFLITNDTKHLPMYLFAMSSWVEVYFLVKYLKHVDTNWTDAQGPTLHRRPKGLATAVKLMCVRPMSVFVHLLFIRYQSKIAGEVEWKWNVSGNMRWKWSLPPILKTCFFKPMSPAASTSLASWACPVARQRQPFCSSLYAQGGWDVSVTSGGCGHTKQLFAKPWVCLWGCGLR